MMIIRQAFELFLEDREAYCSPATIHKYSEDIQYFFRFLEYAAVFPDSSFPDDRNLFREFITFLRSKGIRNTTIRSYCRSVRTFLNYCHGNGFCTDYVKGVKLPRDDAAPKFPLYQEEVALIDAQFDLAQESGRRNYCIVHLMLDCGLRLSEVLHLRMEHVDFNHNIVHVLDSKGNKSRMVLVPDFLLDALRVYLSGRSCGFVFLHLKDGSSLTYNAVKMLFQHLKKSTGINRLHAHLLRHTFATSYLLGGGNLEYLRVFMGHYDYTVTKSYSSLAAQCRMLGADIYRLDPIFFLKGY